MHFCKCDVKIAGDLRNVVPRAEFNPVSWPEVEVLRAIHGDDAVENVVPFVDVKQTAKEEKERLRHLYGPVVDEVYPGKNPQIEMTAAGAKLPEQIPLWKNPIDKEPAGYDLPPEQRPAAKSATKTPFAAS